MKECKLTDEQAQCKTPTAGRRAANECPSQGSLVAAPRTRAPKAKAPLHARTIIERRRRRRRKERRKRKRRRRRRKKEERGDKGMDCRQDNNDK